MTSATLSRRGQPSPPTLRSWHPLGHMLALAKNPLPFFLDTHAEYGDFVRLRLATQTAYFLANPADIKRVLVENTDAYRKQTRGYRKLQLLVGNGLVTSDGDFWLRQRRIAQPAFHRRCLEGFADAMTRAAVDTADDLRSFARRGEAFDMAAMMHRTTLRIAGETLFSADISAGDSFAIGESVGFALDYFNRLVAAPYPYPERLPTRLNRKAQASLALLNGKVEAIIQERRKSDETAADLLGMFMSARDEETGEGMTDRQLRDESITMLLAGHETTANAMAWTFHLLSRHPHVAAKVEAEVDRVLGTRAPTAADFRDLTYTLQVIRESLRLYPPVWVIARQSVQDDVLSGYTVPAGSYIFMAQWAVHRSPSLWRDPEVFDPDRFSADAPAPDRFAYFPFSRGRRQCIGDRFAEMEAVLLLAVLAQQYRFEPVRGRPVNPDPSITLRPGGGVWLTPKARKNLP